MSDNEVRVTSIDGHHTQRGLVDLVVPDGRVQVDPTKARELAGMLIEAAEAAETDEFLMDEFTSYVGLDERGAATMLQRFRVARDAKRKARLGEDAQS